MPTLCPLFSLLLAAILGTAAAPELPGPSLENTAVDLAAQAQGTAVGGAAQLAPDPAASPPEAAPAPSSTEPQNQPVLPHQKDDALDLDDKPAWADEADGSLFSALIRMVLGLFVVLIAIWFALNVGLRRLMRPSENAIIRVHERVPLEAKKSLCLVEVAGSFWLVGTGEGAPLLLTALDADSVSEALAQKRTTGGLRATAGKPFWERLAVAPNQAPADAATSRQAPPETPPDAKTGT